MEQRVGALVVLVLGVVTCLTPCSATEYLDRRSLAMPTYNAATRSALVAFRDVLGNNTKNVAGTWKNSWLPSRACDTWVGTTCNSAGNILSLVLPNRLLEGIIPDAFYAISTLTKIDLKNNKLYGPVRRDLAALNQGLVYLDLSNNFFSGQFPDIWPSTEIKPRPLEPGSTNTLIGWGPDSVDMFIDVSNTYFSGFATINVTNDNFFGTMDDWSYWSFQCIGMQLGGSVNNSCFSESSFINGNFQTREGLCSGDGSPYEEDWPEEYYAPAPRDRAQCASFCGTGTLEGVYPSGMCRNTPGAVCVPSFVNARSNVVTATRCVYPRSSTPAPPPPPPVASTVNSADVAAVRAIVNALAPSLTPTQAAILGTFSASVDSVPCGSLFPYIGCNAAGRIVSLDLSGLDIQSTIPTAIKGLSLLASLNLARNKFFNTWPFDIASDLPKLQRLDVSSNRLVGPVPSGFVEYPLNVNIANNYFSGPPMVVLSKPETQVDPVVYCPANNQPWMGMNCLALTSYGPCALETQRTAAECKTFCGIDVYGMGLGPVGACGGGQAVCSWNGTCNGPVAPPPVPSGINSSPAEYGTLMFFKDFYISYGTPASVFSTWVKDMPCNGTFWKGLVCKQTATAGDSPIYRIVAVNFKGFGLVGPFPGPTTFRGFIWPGKFSISQSIRLYTTYIDLSNNKLYGRVDPLLSKVDGLTYLDISNNFLTGRLPNLKGKFQYLNVANNYIVGSPVVLGLDNTRLCPGPGLAGSFDNNCYDKVAATDPKCPKAAAVRSATSCKAYCNGANSLKTPCQGVKGKPVCKPIGTRLGCAAR